MQWLIDIIKEWVQAQGYLTTGYVKRDDPAAPDFAIGDFIKDFAWHDLDLSSIVPEHAKKVQMELQVINTFIMKTVHFRPNGNTNTWVSSGVYTLVANNTHEVPIDVGLDEAQIIEYRCSALGWMAINLTVKGWWF